MEIVSATEARMDINKILFDEGTVSVVRNCETDEAKNLCITNISSKINKESVIDIGGTYDDKKPEFWFYLTSSHCPGQSHLLNFFVCHRATGNFSISLNEGIKQESNEYTILPMTMKQRMFKSIKPNENFHIATFCLKQKELCETINDLLIIPIKINRDIGTMLDTDVLNRIKSHHNSGEIIPMDENTDLTLISLSGKEYLVHKIVIAAHSPVLRNIVKNNKTSTDTSIQINDESMELLLEYLYTGTLKDYSKVHWQDILNVSKMFEIPNLFLITQQALITQLNVSNALEFGNIAEEHNMEVLESYIIHFINKHQDVMKKISENNSSRTIYQAFSSRVQPKN